MIRALTLTLVLMSAAPGGSADKSARWSASIWQANPVTSVEFESHPAFDPAGSTLYFVKSSTAFRGWKILQTSCHDGKWSKPEPASFAGDGVEADPFLTRDGLTIFFISSRKDDGVSGRSLDLWRVDRPNLSAPWGRPMRLPEPVNSTGNEWFPRLAQDGWLYFGSDRPGGLGLTDIYRARQIGDKWRVENLGPDLNSAGDEYEGEVSPDGRSMILMADGDLYFVSRTGDRWSRRTKLGPQINSDAMEVGALFSPSGNSFLFARDFGKAALPAGGSGELMLATSGKAENWPPTCS